MDNNVTTAKYQPLLTFDMHFPTRQCLVCGTLENYTASMTAVDESLPWLCNRCRETLLKLIEDAKLKLIEDTNTSNALDALDCVEERKKGEWDMFDLISSAWYGKGMYFKQDNGTVYSRHSGEYMTVDEAIREFISLIDIDELTDTNVGKWIPVTERLPKSVRKSYLCLTDTGYHCEVRWTDNVYGLLTSSMDNKWGWSIADVPQYCKVTHWMPLPRPPKEE